MIELPPIELPPIELPVLSMFYACISIFLCYILRYKLLNIIDRLDELEKKLMHV